MKLTLKFFLSFITETKVEIYHSIIKIEISQKFIIIIRIEIYDFIIIYHRKLTQLIILNCKYKIITQIIN